MRKLTLRKIERKKKEKKINIEYKHWNVLGDNVANQFSIVAVEAFGIILKENITHVALTALHSHSSIHVCTFT